MFVNNNDYCKHGISQPVLQKGFSSLKRCSLQFLEFWAISTQGNFGMESWISGGMQVGAVLSCPRMLCGAILPHSLWPVQPPVTTRLLILGFLKKSLLCHSTVTRTVIPHTNGTVKAQGSITAECLLNGKWTKYTTFIHKKSGSHPFKEHQLMAFYGQLVIEVHWLPLGRLVSIKCAVVEGHRDVKDYSWRQRNKNDCPVLWMR